MLGTTPFNWVGLHRGRVRFDQTSYGLMSYSNSRISGLGSSAFSQGDEVRADVAQDLQRPLRDPDEGHPKYFEDRSLPSKGSERSFDKWPPNHQWELR